jgi:hypothetical protein
MIPIERRPIFAVEECRHRRRAVLPWPVGARLALLGSLIGWLMLIGGAVAVVLR